MTPPTKHPPGHPLREQAKKPLNWLLPALLVAAVCEWSHAGDLWIFLFSGLAIIPLAGLLGEATETLAESLGEGIGGLLNATFGNAAELIIGLMVLAKGPEMYPLVKASLSGSIIGNVLLVLGLSILIGGLSHRQQKFNATAAGMGTTLLALAAIGLIMPTTFYFLFRVGATLSPEETRNVESLSEEIAVILAIIYGLSLLFTLRTHHHLFGGEAEGPHPAEGGAGWGRGTALTVLLVATAGIAWMSEMLVGSVEKAGAALGMNQVFIGVIVVAVVGNAAEHATAVLMARKNKMDLAVQIAVGSSIQIALFVAPVLVFASMAMHPDHPLDLHFSPLELIAIIIAVAVLALVCNDGESHWMEGVMLLGVYVILALGFYHLPVPAHPAAH